MIKLIYELLKEELEEVEKEENKNLVSVANFYCASGNYVPSTAYFTSEYEEKQYLE